MCFGNKLKGDDPSSRINNNDYNNHVNSRPVDSKPINNDSIKMPQNTGYAPPPGPPPRQQKAPEIYDAPPGPPPNQNPYTSPPSHDQYAPPTGPPPFQNSYTYASPPGPPPPQEPYHDWQTAVPDTSLLPPPPSLGNQRSASNNATEFEADQAEGWCGANSLYAPHVLSQESLRALETGEIGVILPRSMKGELNRPRPGVWSGKTKASCPDSSILSTIPLYSVYAHSPLQTGRSKTVYYEVRISPSNRREVSLALGFSAPPYPTFRLPGWHRGSLAVHGDDGGKYINDRWGGKDFTRPFQAGETIGIGITFSPRNLDAPPEYGEARTTQQKPINVEVFFTRDGRKEGGWNLHEEGDAEEDLPVTGLEGINDLVASVGVFENVEFEIVFNEREWMFRP